MFRKVAALFVWTLFVSQPAQASLIHFTAKIDGSQEVPPTDSLAFGTGVFTLDTATNRLSFAIVYTAALLEGPEILAHIHGPADPGVNAGILFDLPLGELKAGEVDINTKPNTAFVEDLLAGKWYVNIHSTVHQGGEIRGQILLPEPAAAGLLLMGVAGLAWSGRPR